MNENRGCNIPGILFAVIVIISILLCALLPAIFAFIKAGLEDGFSFEAFDLGPSDWWSVGMVLLFLGLATLCGIGCRIAKEGQSGK